jgi:hypothetical protein
MKIELLSLVEAAQTFGGCLCRCKDMLGHIVVGDTVSSAKSCEKVCKKQALFFDQCTEEAPSRSRSVGSNEYGSYDIIDYPYFRASPSTSLT